MQPQQKISDMSPFDMVDRLVSEGEIKESAAKLIVDMFSGKSSPEIKEVIEVIHSELTRTDLATKAYLKAALEHYATKADMTEMKIDLIDRITQSEGRLRNWIIGSVAVFAALSNLSKILSALGLG